MSSTSKQPKKQPNKQSNKTVDKLTAMGSIRLPRRHIGDGNRCGIRITYEAYSVLARLQSRTGLSMIKLASTILVQAEDLIEFVDSEEVDSDDE